MRPRREAAENHENFLCAVRDDQGFNEAAA